MSKEQKVLEAKLRQAQIAAKRRPLQESGALPSQWGGMTSETRLLTQGHFQRTGAGAQLAFLREEVRKAKKAQEGKKIVHVKR